MVVGQSYAYVANALNVNPWEAIGSPAQAVIANVYVAAGIVIGAADASAPAMLINHYDGSTVNIFVGGKVGAAGGTGGGGDRSRNNGTASSFVGGGGGGGAGANPGAGGLHAVESDPDATAMTDGAAGTTTTGGAGGENDFNGNIGNSPYVAGSVVNRLARNPAILIWPANGHSITVNIYNGGEIFAGGDGGLGGFQDGSLPGGANDPEDGEDLPNYYDDAPGILTDHPAIGYRSGQVTLNLISGFVHPSVKGRIIGFSAAP